MTQTDKDKLRAAAEKASEYGLLISHPTVVLELLDENARLREAVHRWLSWYGDDYGTSVFPDEKEGERDQGALDIVFGRNALQEIGE